MHSSNPLANTIYSPTEVDSYKSFLTNRGLSYIDHWVDWTVGNAKKEFKLYLTKDSTQSNMVADCWATALSACFIGK